MRTIGTGCLVFVLVATAPCQDKQKLPKGKITVGKDTTFITGPLDKDGYIDYVAALNDRLSQGVTPENNANVLIWKALGPHPEGSTMPAEFFRRMGIAAPPERGDYFIDLVQYLEKHSDFDPTQNGDALAVREDRATRRAWKPQELPEIAAWLKANEKPLAVAVEASKRTHYYSPLVPPDGKKSLIDVSLPGVQKCRSLANALRARAMLRAGQGNEESAWQDLLASHRLGRLVAWGGTAIEFLVGVAIDINASEADLAFLERTRPKAERIAGYLRDLRELPAIPALIDKVNLAERFMLLQAVTMVDRQGLRYLRRLEGGEAKAIPELDERIVLRNIDWDPALRGANRWYDRLVAGLSEPDYGVRAERLKQFDTALRKLRAEIVDIGTLAVLLDKKQSGSTRGKLLGDVMITLLMPALHKIQGAADRTHQTQDNLTVAFALERYRSEKGGYPKTLDALTPDYLKQIPRDLFSGNALVYRPTFPKAAGPANGYLLYSVGVNGKDEGGRGYEDNPQGDDLSVCMPLPAVRQP
jgi:hypothetical protein